MEFLKRLTNLLTVKSLVTIALTAVFCTLAVTGGISDEFFQTIFSMVIAFYFGVQHEKKSSTTAAQAITDGEKGDVSDGGNV